MLILISKPLIHSKSSARKYGGIWQDYVDIHNLMDSSKAHVPDNRHRCIFHSSFGIYIVEQIFGISRTNSDNKDYSVRSVAEDHIIEDLGVIPTLQDYLDHMELKPWMQKITKSNCPTSAKNIMQARKDFKIGKD